MANFSTLAQVGFVKTLCFQKSCLQWLTSYLVISGISTYIFMEIPDNIPDYIASCATDLSQLHSKIASTESIFNQLQHISNILTPLDLHFTASILKFRELYVHYTHVLEMGKACAKQKEPKYSWWTVNQCRRAKITLCISYAEHNITKFVLALLSESQSLFITIEFIRFIIFLLVYCWR